LFGVSLTFRPFATADKPLGKNGTGELTIFLVERPARASLNAVHRSLICFTVPEAND
jgi:hypothetical protein